MISALAAKKSLQAETKLDVTLHDTFMDGYDGNNNSSD